MSIDGIGYDSDIWGKWRTMQEDTSPRTFGGSVGGSVSGRADKEGNAEAKAEAHGSYKDDDGNRASVEVSGRATRDREGNVSGDVAVEAKYEREF